MSTEEIIAGLTAANAKLDQARQQAAAAAQAATEAQSLVSAALRGSAAGPLVSMIATVRENLARAAAGIAPARTKVDETVQQAKALGN